ncbi:50S ribosomal protein L29 [Psittacicella melopsittaci]|uniref:Large ribosomal subunit protein uL29 n=1 Tax=Psittacicella melopsittaci TaxID=2028576 RepID=A0A3A1Y4F0_9GAMM|nr:50S ribosomal protein L29 [Psittacicella melopsittaci]RIY32179.1 50S ribosomal protein L29 [Psittacicella melopsittaci]
MSEKDLNQELVEARTTLFGLRQQLKTRQLEKTNLVKKARRDVARLLTQLNKAGK